MPKAPDTGELKCNLAVYVVTNQGLSRGRTTLEVVQRALSGGARAIQLREKDMTDRDLLALGKEIRGMTQRVGAVFIVNDRVDIALALDADGVHLGQDDMPVEIARKILGPSRIIGVSVESEEEARAATAGGASYLGTGPIYTTSTKADAGSAYGPALVSRIKGATYLPVVGIGGISAKNAKPVVEAGADGLAVVSAVVSSPSIEAAVSELLAVYGRQPEPVDLDRSNTRISTRRRLQK